MLKNQNFIPALSVNIIKSVDKSLEFGNAKKCGYKFTGGVWEPFTRASDSNSRVIRRGMEGATATDMTVIAQQAALDYERKLAEESSNDEEE